MIRIIASGYEAARSSITHLLLDIWNTAKVQNRLLLTANCLAFTYSRYPSRDAALTNEACWKGRFENLQQYVACGIDYKMSEEVKKILTIDALRRGVFHWDEHINKIRGVNLFWGVITLLAAKQMHMIGYLFELAYNICINYVANGSLNPGLESVLVCGSLLVPFLASLVWPWCDAIVSCCGIVITVL